METAAVRNYFPGVDWYTALTLLLIGAKLLSQTVDLFVSSKERENEGGKTDFFLADGKHV